MKKIAFALLPIALGTIAAFGQSKFDAASMVYLGELNTAVLSRGEGAEEPKVSATIAFTDAAAAKAFAAELASDDVFCRLEFVISDFTPTELRALAERSDVTGITCGQMERPLLEIARAAAGVDALHEGTDLPHTFTGKGVITALFDEGVDANHANFRRDGASRISRLWTITGNTSAVTTYDTPAKIDKFETDKSSATHGTHVLGIMSGSFNEKARIAYLRNGTTLATSNSRAVPYYGVAPDAELVVGCGTLGGNNISKLADLVAAYAKENGRPAVLNLSLGHNYGPHDGTTPSNKILADIGKDVILCISAGNEGADPISIRKKFSNGDTQLKTCISKSSAAVGVVDIWSSNSKQLKITFVAINPTTGQVGYSREFAPVPAGMNNIIGGSGNNYINVTNDRNLDPYFGTTCTISYACDVASYNNRYNAYLSFSLGSGTTKGYVPALIIEGDAGASVDVFSASATLMLTSNNMAGYSNGTTEVTINDMACGENVISVGAYVNRPSWPTLAGMWGYGDNIAAGDIAYFSSYGATFDGRQLPIITGPGMGMVSSYSYYYVQAETPVGSNPESLGLSVNYTHDKRASYWAEMSGTSMSSPFVAGVIALWLEAEPTLTYDDVVNILKATATKDQYTAASPERFGYGKINALAGIKHILSSDGVKEVKTEKKVLVNEVSNGTFDIFAPGASSVNANLYSLSGASVAATNEQGENATISAAGVAAGVYVLRVTADGKTEIRKVVIR